MRRRGGLALVAITITVVVALCPLPGSAATVPPAVSIAAMQSWGFNAARVELNESCWLGVQGVKAADSGPAYQQAIETYVEALNAAGMYVIIDMHFSSRGGARKATRQVPMPDERYAPLLCASVANAFKNNPAVIFDLFNEPYPNRNA